MVRGEIVERTGASAPTILPPVRLRGQEALDRQVALARVVVEAPAARAGLRTGDVILALANAQVADVKQFEAMLGKLDKNRPVSVLVRRGEWAQYAVIRPGQ